MAFDFSIKGLKSNFFKPELLIAKADRARRKMLSKAGAFVRQRAKTSIRKRKAVSAIGAPPSSHEGSLRKLIFFAYDPNRDSVVIGPALYRAGEAPKLLEHGGTAVRTRKSGESRTLHYRPRPFMLPALEAEMPKFKELLRGMIS